LPKDRNALLLGAELALQRKDYLLASRALTTAAAASDDESLAERATRVAFETSPNQYVLKARNAGSRSTPRAKRHDALPPFAALRLYRIDEATEQLMSY